GGAPETEAAVVSGTASYTGPGPLTAASALATWTLDVPAVVAVIAATALYAGGVRSARRAGGRWPALRTAAFAAGLVLIALAACSFVGVYAHVLFWVYVVQACLLLLVAPLLLGAGAPLSLAAATPRHEPAAERAKRSPVFRVARVPGFGPLVLIAATIVLFFTPLMTASLQSAAAGEVVRAALVVAGLVVALPVTDEQMSLSSMAYAAALGLAFVEFLVDAVPGIVLRLQSHVLQPEHWAALARPWGPSPLEDQRLGGAVLWFFGEAGDIPFIAALLAAWVISDAREAKAHDAAMDAADHRRALLTAQAAPGSRQEPDLTRPWWETDPSVFGEARARRYGWRPENPSAQEQPGERPGDHPA
ncbi:MAG: cytochrome c oxidase assembly protein, partial [Kineosporiaceae bacterium]